MLRFALPIALAALAAACTSTTPGANAPAAPEMKFDADFRGRARCLDRSPALRVYDAPAGTRRLRLEFFETASISGRRSAFEAPYAGRGTVAAGAFAGYVAPCPPVQSDYEVTLTALGADGAILAQGRVRARLPVEVPGLGRGLNQRNQ